MNKNKPTSDIIKIMHQRYIKGDKKRLAYIEQEKARLEIAQKIYELRTQANLTQKQLAIVWELNNQLLAVWKMPITTVIHLKCLIKLLKQCIAMCELSLFHRATNASVPLELN